MNEAMEHLLDHVKDVDAVVVAQEGQIDAPEGWVLESTVICNGKRIRTFRIAGP
jgi:hypothetical protein